MMTLAAMVVATATPDRWEFIWGSYGVFIVVFAAFVIAPVIWRRKLKRRLKHYYKRKRLLDSGSKQ